MNRHQFLSTGAAGAVSLAAFPHHLFASDTKKSATDRIKLGPKKIELSRLAFGAGTHGGGGRSDQTRKLGYKGFADLFRAGYDQGQFLGFGRPVRQPHLHTRSAEERAA